MVSTMIWRSGCARDPSAARALWVTTLSARNEGHGPMVVVAKFELLDLARRRHGKVCHKPDRARYFERGQPLAAPCDQRGSGDVFRVFARCEANRGRDALAEHRIRQTV